MEESRGFKLSVEDFLVFLLLGPSIFLYHSLSRAKFIYFIPLLFFVYILSSFLLRKDKRKFELYGFDINIFNSVIIYVLVASLAILASSRIFSYEIVIRDILIIMSPLFIFFLEMRFKMRHVYFLFIIWVLSYVAWVGSDVLNWQASMRIISSNYNEGTEFHNGVVFGLFFLVFFIRRKYLWLIASFIVVVISGKRSIFLGFIPAFGGGMIVYLLFGNNIGNPRLILLLLVIFLVSFVVGFYLIETSKYFVHLIDTEGTASVDKFLMGREAYVIALKNAFFDATIPESLLGHGPGQADKYLMEFVRPDWANRSEYANPHNDYMKMLFDYGLIGSLGLFFIFYSLYAKSFLGVMVLLYTFGVFFVDNSLIFIYYILTACVVARLADPSAASVSK